MRLSTIVVCLLLAPSRSVGCFEHTSEATPGLSTPHRGYIEAGTGEASAEYIRMTGAGVAAIALIVVVARGYQRAATRSSDVVLPSRFRLDDAELGPSTGHACQMAATVPTPIATA